jgi:formylglycine-generating enzyme required for sulfatase activity
MSAFTISLAEYANYLNAIAADTPANVSIDANGNVFYGTLLLFSLAQNNDVTQPTEPTTILFDYELTYVDGVYGYAADAGDFPIVGVTWYGAVAYCNWLSQQKGAAPAYTESTVADEWRPALLSVADWQDGFSSAERDAWLAGYSHSYRLPMTNHIGDVDPYNEFYWAAVGDSSDVYGTENGGNYWESGDDFDNGPVDPRYFDPTADGVYNLAGNVWEWSTDTLAFGNLGERAVTGGSWYTFQDSGRADTVVGISPDSAYSDVGFRVVCGVDFEFQIEIATDTAFTQNVQTNVSAARTAGYASNRDWQPNLQPSTTYFWRVRTVHEGVTDLNPNWFGAFGSGVPYATFTTSDQTRLAQPLSMDLTGDTGGWSLVSTNMEPDEQYARKLFGGDSVAWKWNATALADDESVGTYERVVKIEPYEGFWLYRPVSDANFEVTGFTPTYSDTFVFAGWNLVGVLEENTVFPSVFGDARNHIFGYGYSNVSETHTYERVDFVTSFMNPGKGYWVYASEIFQVELSTEEEPVAR